MARAGFTLIEMLITLALILILTVMFYGHGSRSWQQRQKIACQKNLQTIYIALEIYANEHQGAFPIRGDAQTAEAALSLLVPRYTTVTESFICPGSKDAALPEGESFEKRKISYAYYMGRRLADSTEAVMSDEQINTKAKMVSELVFSADGKSKPGKNHNKFGGNVLFCDGRTEESPAKSAFPLSVTPGVVLLNPKP